MVDPINELNMVFETCGITDAGMRANIINREGFQSLAECSKRTRMCRTWQRDWRLGRKLKGESTSERSLSSGSKRLSGGCVITRNEDSLLTRRTLMSQR